MRFSINIPNFGDFADARPRSRRWPRPRSRPAGTGCSSGTTSCTTSARRRGQPFGDPWMLLTAAALATSRLRLGTLVTPVARRRPEQLARQVATLDALSGGRVIFGAGLGGPIEDEFGSFGEPTDPAVLAERLDEGLDLLQRYWSGEPVNHDGRHYQVRDVTLLPASVQRPRPPVWIGGFWPHRRPMRRAARWDGVVPLFETARHGQIPPVDQVRDLVAYVHRQRDRPGAVRDRPRRRHPATPRSAHDLIAPLADAGATLVGRTAAPDRPGLRPARAGAAPDQRGPAGAVGRLRAPRTRRRSARSRGAAAGRRRRRRRRGRRRQPAPAPRRSAAPTA